MDLWMIIVLAVVLIVAFIIVGGRSMFASTRGDGNTRRTGEEPSDFSDDPGTGRR